MLQSFTRNFEDNSTDAGFQFTFYCDVCNDGFKSSFIESETYKKGKGLRGLSSGIGVLGSLVGGRAGNIGYSMQRGGNIFSERFEGQSPEWHKEHQNAFSMAQNESQRFFHRCHGCRLYVCDACYNEVEGLCTNCAPRQEVYIAQARAASMRRNIDQAGMEATVWKGEIESKVTTCPVCGKPAGSGKFCNNCGASMEMKECPKCGAMNAPSIRFCNNCGQNLTQAAAQRTCSSCGMENSPGVKFCGGCGAKLE